MEQSVKPDLISELIRENEIFRKALEFYASEWTARAAGESFVVSPSKTLKEDRGRIAYEALLKQRERFWGYHVHKLHGFGD